MTSKTTTSNMAAKLKALERENRELRQANKIPLDEGFGCRWLDHPHRADLEQQNIWRIRQDADMIPNHSWG
jgi:hypothetical protein